MVNENLSDLVEPGKVISCKACGSKEYSLSRSGPHLRADCKACEKFIQFVPQAVNFDRIDWNTEKIPLPKYKDNLYAEVARLDPDYIRWMAENIKGRPGKIADAAILEFGL